MAIIEMFPECFIALQTEVLKDPKLIAYLETNAQHSDGLEEKLAHICTYLEVVVDGMYELKPMCKMLTNRLMERNSLIILTHW